MSDSTYNPVTEADLADFDEAYERADVSDDEFESVPDGKYQCVVECVELVRTTNGDPMLKWTLRILGPTHEGRLLWRYNVLSSDENVVWLKKDLRRCGIHLARVSELPANLERLLDIKLEVNKKTRNDFEAVYIEKRLRTADEAAERESGGTSTNTGRKTKGKGRKTKGKAQEALTKF